MLRNSVDGTSVGFTSRLARSRRVAKATFLGVAPLTLALNIDCGGRTAMLEDPEAGLSQGSATSRPSQGGAAYAGGPSQGGSVTYGGGPGYGGAASAAGGAELVEHAGNANEAGRSGSPGMAAAGGAAAANACSLMIDDFENGTGRIHPCQGRVGSWYSYNDGFGIEYPPPATPGVPILPTAIWGGRGASRWAMFASYTFYQPILTQRSDQNYGAGIGVDLNFDGQHYGLYDASAYDGISFWARSSGTTLLVRLNTDQTTPTLFGGSCTIPFCRPAQKAVSVSYDWKQYFVVFNNIYAGSDSFNVYLGSLAKDRLTNIQFLFTSSDKAADIWIDDLSFFVGTPPAQ